MEIVEKYPPNIDLIRIVLNPSPSALYCYGDKIYNPSKRKVPADIMYHEYIHSLQQGENPEQWWNRYLEDPQFRLEQEIEAYGKQYIFVKENIPDGKFVKEALESMSFALSGSSYGGLLTYGEAESKIRNYGKK